MRQKELEEALAEARRLAIQKLREQLETERKMAYVKFMRMESNLFRYNQQISRAFVYSYYDVLGWIEGAKENNDSQLMPNNLIHAF